MYNIKIFEMKKLRLPIAFIFIIAAFISCDKRNVEKFSDPIVSDYGIFPVTMESDQGGNLTCEDLIGEYPGGTTGRINYDAETNTFDADFSAYGLTVTVTGETYVSFEMDPSSEWCVGAVIVKGGNASNVFYYDPGVKSDQGLTAPINPSGSPAGLSNITFCFVECEKPEWVIAFKAQLTFPGLTGYALGVSGGIDANISYYNIGYNYYDLNQVNVYPFLNNSVQIGTITATDFWKDGVQYLRMIIDTDNHDWGFWGSYMYVGTIEGFNALRTWTDGRYLINYESFPFKKSTMPEPCIFEIPFSSITE